MATIVAVGAQWGDEGKGKIVDWLAERSDLVARFHGGNNAGHTLVVDPEVLLGELDALRERGVLRDPQRVRVSGRAHVILEWHKKLDLAREERAKGHAIGTTGRGIGPTYEDKVARRGVRVADLLDPDGLRELLDRFAEAKNFELVRYCGWEPVDVDQLWEQCVAWGKRLEPFVDHTGHILDRALRDGKRILFEGAQGTFLDIDHGTYPYVTSSNCVAGAVAPGSGIGPTCIDRVLGITKAYTTRVGGGPFPTELEGPLGERLQKQGAEFGATTGRRRRCGWLDVVMLREAAIVNGFTALAVNKLDVLSGFDEIAVATRYRIDGKITEDFPMTLRELERAEPVYETFAGWREEIADVREFDVLPDSARRYVETIESLTGIPVDLISVGPGRDETIVRREPFPG